MELGKSAMRAHLARLRCEIAGALLLRAGAKDRERATGLVEQARTLAAELGLVTLLPLIAERTARAEATKNEPVQNDPVAAAQTRVVLHREGEYWAIAWGAHTLRLRDSRGLQVHAIVHDHGCESELPVWVLDCTPGVLAAIRAPRALIRVLAAAACTRHTRRRETEANSGTPEGPAVSNVA